MPLHLKKIEWSDSCLVLRKNNSVFSNLSAKNLVHFSQKSCFIESSLRLLVLYRSQKMDCATSVCLSVVVRPNLSKEMLNQS